ncbi:hypothetical protein [Microbulbifer sp. SAOS-129_SWC]|uniref:hypothetical protein n=1 Tax=Microbulbifer sp. SAOS-129_SWC TaxID=3145235 RepID=UPI0032166554
MSASNGDEPIFLKAGVNTNVRAPGDFVFLKEAAFPVEVTIHGQTVKMDPGESRGIPRSNYNEPAFSSFEAKNTGPADQSVVFVVGEGSYNKVIVDGQVNISAYVKTAARGTADSLPTDYQREVGALSVGETVITADTADWTGTGVKDVSYGVACIFNGLFYLLYDDNTISVIDPYQATGTFIKHYGGIGSLWGSAGMAINEYGVVYTKGSSGQIFAGQIGGTPSGALSQVNTFGPYVATTRYGLMWWKGRLYSLNGSGKAVHSCAPDGTDIKVELDLTPYLDSPEQSNGGADVFLHLGNGEVMIYDHYVTGVGAWKKYHVNDAGVFERKTGDVNSEMSHDSGRSAEVWRALTPDCSRGVVTFSDARYRIAEFQNVTSYAELYHQRPGDAATIVRKRVLDPISVVTTRVGDAVIYDWAGFVLGDQFGNYADYLTGYAYDNGDVVRTVDTGTQTFSRRSVSVPDLAVLDGSTMTFKVLPDIFD